MNDEQLDMHIKECITSELQQITVPSVDKEWNRFRNLVIKEKNNRRIRPGSLIVAAVIVLIMFSSIALFSPVKANAFGERIIQIFNHLIGKTTQNKTVTINNDDSMSKPPLVQNLESNIEKETSLQEAQKSVYFKIAEPKYLPSETETQKVLITNLSPKVYKITIEYISLGRMIILTQQNITGTVSQGNLYDTDDTISRDITINGAQATLLTKKDGMNVLIWHQRGLLLQLTGKLPVEEFLKIAQSIS